jgi:hypothetical protein
MEQETMMKYIYFKIEDWWSKLSEIANGPPIDGTTPANQKIKNEWLALAAACGMQLASELGLQDAECTVRPENAAISGSVDVVGKVPYMTKENVMAANSLKARITFDDPYTSALAGPGYACIALKVGPWNWPCAPLYHDFANNCLLEADVVRHQMYNQFWPVHLMLEAQEIDDESTLQ